MTSRLAFLPPDACVQDFQHHVRSLQDAGHEIVLITTNLPCKSLVAAMEAVDFERAHIIDAVTETGMMAVEHPGTDRVTMIRSPTMLEMIAMRAERVALTMENPYVMVCCLNTMALYNELDAVEEFTHFFANRMAVAGIPVDFLVQSSKGSDGRIESAASKCVDERVPILLA